MKRFLLTRLSQRRTARRRRPFRKRGTRPALSKRIEDGAFAEMFILFNRALGHETGGVNTMMGIMAEFDLPELSGEKVDRMTKLRRRLLIISSMLREDKLMPATQRDLGKFSSRELRLLAVKKSDGQEKQYRVGNIDAARRMALKDVREYRELLRYFHRHINRICSAYAERYGEKGTHGIKMNLEIALNLMDCLEALCSDDLENASGLLAMKVIQKEGYNSPKDIVTGFFGRAKAGLELTGYQPEYELDAGLHLLEVKVNPFFHVLIMRNLISNSLRAAEEKGVWVELNIRASANDGKLLISFEDNGNGMSSEVMERLNSGIRATTKESGGYHGVGFQYCRDLARKMGGDLHIARSEPGVGTTVLYELRLA